jgi:hypothetical protein
VIQRRPGWSGNHSLVMFAPFEKVAALKSANCGTVGSTDGLGSTLGSTLGSAEGPVLGSDGDAEGGSLTIA